MEPLKNQYSKLFFKAFVRNVTVVYPSFNGSNFINSVFINHWDALELKQRMRHVSTVLNQHLSGSYSNDIDILLRVIDVALEKEQQGEKFDRLVYMFVPDYVQQYGLNDYLTSVKAMEKITSFFSCEFAVRPFIVKYENKMMQQMLVWASSKNEHVRRLASEGCRPRLPWAMALPRFKKDPSLVLPILKLLKNDSSLYVRRSVANNLNDIAKDNPKLVINMAQQWYGKTPQTNWVVKHACRTLLKQGNQTIMRLFGYGNAKLIKVTNFKVLTPQVVIGDRLVFQFNLNQTDVSNMLIRLEYAVYFRLKNGQLSKKVFKISEKSYSSQNTHNIQRKHSFKLISTRVYYPGLHRVSVIVNGVEQATKSFVLK